MLPFSETTENKLQIYEQKGDLQLSLKGKNNAYKLENVKITVVHLNQRNFTFSDPLHSIHVYSILCK